MTDGEVLQVVVDYPQTRENILKLVERTRNEILGVEEAKGGFKITIRKRAISQSDGDFKKKDLSCPVSS
jgi:TusA-related sulfurtransferase